MITLFLIVSVALVAFTNGANANFKGVASLYGSGTATLRQALLWGTVTTLAGSIAALFLADTMLKKFSGKGLVDDATTLSPIFLSSVAAGAALTSFIATRFGFPVSTTHALVGALLGAGMLASADSVKFMALGKNFLYPLLLSPVLAACLGAMAAVLIKPFAAMLERHRRGLDLAHYLSAGCASFARGLNDTPKMATLLMVVPQINVTTAIIGVALMIAVGALVDARNVAETLGKKVTDMNAQQGFSANVVTAILVTTASLHSFPVSTTHVSVGSLLGMGAMTGQAKWGKVLEILLAWITTVPCGAITAAVIYWVCSRIV